MFAQIQLIGRITKITPSHNGGVSLVINEIAENSAFPHFFVAYGNITSIFKNYMGQTCLITGGFIEQSNDGLGFPIWSLKSINIFNQSDATPFYSEISITGVVQRIELNDSYRRIGVSTKTKSGKLAFWNGTLNNSLPVVKTSILFTKAKPGLRNFSNKVFCEWSFYNSIIVGKL